ncbi:MAG: cytochrome P450 [Frankia sp.]|nr:cytochrome P450 [Frankia sp.]
MVAVARGARRKESSSGTTEKDARTVADLAAMDFFRDSDKLIVDPYPYYEALRAQCPAVREPHHRVVMVTGYEEAVAIFHDHERFSSCNSVTGPFPGFPVPLDGYDDISDLIEEHRSKLPFNDQLPTLDPPVHTNHRALLMKLITPKRLKENEAELAGIADQLLDSFLEGGEGEWIKGFAGPYTMLVIADLLGVPAADRDEFRRKLGQTGTIGGTGEDDQLAHSPLEYLYDRFREYVEDRRANPRQDVLTELATATFPDGSLPEVMDVVRVAANLFAAGQETTVRLLGATLQLIGERPDLQAMLRADPSRIGSFIEEALRVESPVKGDFRMSRCPVTIAGTEYPAGTTVMLMMGAANRDPRRFADPATFDPARPNSRQHIAFGRGVHSCPGAPLARAETRTAIERMLARTSDIRISEEHHGPPGARRYSYFPTYILRGLTTLHLEFTPVAGGGAG